MKFVLIIQLFTSLIGASALYLALTPQHAASFAAGGLVIALSFFLLGIGWKLIFEKKLIALAIGIIVFKYAILGIIIFKLTKLSWFNTLWFALGVASFVLSALGYALKETLREGKADGI